MRGHFREANEIAETANSLRELDESVKAFNEPIKAMTPDIEDLEKARQFLFECQGAYQNAAVNTRIAGRTHTN